ncbi:MAG: Lrp/AsnC family transcriptional regulator [Veillonellaceae bacterium]|jgi:DNA-binding Lrp family transcriptional regulator|nr:Lrp/AsnC family transcriptional regulator [Veillonellaceae bacterium]
MELTQFDKQLLNLVQTGLPLTPAPFADLADRLGCPEQQVLEQLARLRDEGIIRRLGAFFDAEALGYRGWLVAVKVEPVLLAEVARAVNAWPEVTHNDERDHEYNLWFTIQTRSEARQQELLCRIGAMAGVSAVIVLPTTDRYKVNVEFRME